MNAEKALRTLQQRVRSTAPIDYSRGYRSGAVPADLQSEAARQVIIDRGDSDVLDATVRLLSADERFEYMQEKEIDEALWRLVCLAVLHRNSNHVAGFVAQHARVPEEHTCYFQLEQLTVPREVDLLGVRFLPTADIPAPKMPWPIADDASLVAVACRGTGRTQMAARARDRAEHALRILRITLRDHHGIHDRQLRFRLGETHWLDDQRSGWSLGPEKGWELELHESLIPYVTGPRVASLPYAARTDIERRVNRALVWLEHSQLATDPLVRTLSLFYGLEAILGDRDGGQKGPRLATRRATLGAVTVGEFSHPFKVIVYYDIVRSAAVHGDEPAPLNERDFVALQWSIRNAVSELLEYADARHLTKRSQVVTALVSEGEWARIVEEFIAPIPEWAAHLEPPS